MLMMVYKYVGMYLVMGLVATAIWVVACTAYTMYRFYKTNNNPSQQEMDDFLDDFYCIMYDRSSRNEGRAERNELFKSKKAFAVYALQSYIIWPANIAYGASRIPELNKYFADLEKS